MEIRGLKIAGFLQVMRVKKKDRFSNRDHMETPFDLQRNEVELTV